MSIHLFAGSRIMVFLQEPPLRIFLIHISARYADFREKARSARGGLMNGGRPAISAPCAIIFTMKNAGNPTMVLNRGQNLRTCPKIMSVLSVQPIQKLFYGTGTSSSRDSHPCTINKKQILFFFKILYPYNQSSGISFQGPVHDPISGRYPRSGEFLFPNHKLTGSLFLKNSPDLPQ